MRTDLRSGRSRARGLGDLQYLSAHWRWSPGSPPFASACEFHGTNTITITLDIHLPGAQQARPASGGGDLAAPPQNACVHIHCVNAAGVRARVCVRVCMRVNECATPRHSQRCHDGRACDAMSPSSSSSCNHAERRTTTTATATDDGRRDGDGWTGDSVEYARCMFACSHAPEEYEFTLRNVPTERRGRLGRAVRAFAIRSVRIKAITAE